MGMRALAAILGLSSVAAAPWPTAPTSTALEARIPPPPGYTRIGVEEGSLGAWLRALPVRAGHPAVHLFDGRIKKNQDAHAYVLDLDVGAADLQQCADAVMRLWAEYQWASGARDRICFRYTSGDRASWSRWSAGERPIIRGNRVKWAKSAQPSSSYQTFRNYLDSVFTYAGTHSLAKDVRPVADPRRIEPGDLFIQGGFPGHAVVVLDVAEDAQGARVFLLAQSFMPAQEPHVLRGPGGEGVWYPATGRGALDTPEWAFDWRDLRRFAGTGCP